MTGSWLPYCIERYEYNGMEFPTAFLAFPNDFEYSMVCSLCADFDFDVLELFINGVNFLVFFEVAEFTTCTFFCEINGFTWKNIYILHDNDDDFIKERNSFTNHTRYVHCIL